MFQIPGSMISASISSRIIATALLLFAFGPHLHAGQAPKADATKAGGPTDEKARKTYDSGLEWEKRHDDYAAVDAFRKANKQDGGQCKECLLRAYVLAMRMSDSKNAEGVGREMLLQAGTDEEKAGAHYRIALALQKQGLASRKDKCFSDSCDEFKAALGLVPQAAAMHYSMGISLAELHRDDAARQEFAAFLDNDKGSPDMHVRAQRYMDRIELARARMTPPFSVTTIDGRHVTMDSLAGKVVLIDFWATWCGPCREALPHIKRIASKFEGQPFVVLSVSLDSDEAKWRDFVGKNEMTWLQYRDGGFDGAIAKQFGVTAIPATFTIDADGVLEDQHVGDADIEGKLKKLIAQAVAEGNRKPLVAAAGN